MLQRLGTVFRERHRDEPFRCVILDESHHCKFTPPPHANHANPTHPARASAQPARASAPPARNESWYEVLSELCGQLRSTEQKLICLSGTPMSNGRISSMYGQLRLLHPHAFADYEAFGRRFCVNRVTLTLTLTLTLTRRFCVDRLVRQCPREDLSGRPSSCSCSQP